MLFSILINELTNIKNGKQDFTACPQIFWDVNYWNSDIYPKLVDFHWSAIQCIAEPVLTNDMVMSAISQHAGALQFVPARMRTRHVCEIAASLNIEEAFPHIPEHLRTAEMCAKWVPFCASSPEYFALIPERERTHDLCLSAVSDNPIVMELVPLVHHTEEMSLAFLQGGGHDHWLEDIQTIARSRMLCLACLRAGKGPIEAVPAEFLDEEMLQANEVGMSN